MKSSLIFIQKPIMYIKHNNIKYVEFHRIDSKAGTMGREFDLTVHQIDQEGGPEQFKNIDKHELKVLINYFKDAKIKMRQFNADTKTTSDLEDYDSDKLDEVIR